MYEPMRALTLALVVGALCVGSVGSARAEEPPEEDYYARPGVYLLAQFTNNLTLGDISTGGVRNSMGTYSTGVGGAFGYRFNTYLIGFDPGDNWSYFPAVPELLITVAIVSIEVMAYIVIVRRYPILRGERSADDGPSELAIAGSRP